MFALESTTNNLTVSNNISIFSSAILIREREREKRRETEKGAGGSISGLSGDPASGKGFRCVQNKNQGIEGLFYVAWGMEGSYHPQGRS